MDRATPSFPQYVFMAWCLFKHKDNSTFKERKKVKLSLFLTKYHAMKTYWGSGGIAPGILYLGT
jgi:hypothetical protein